MNNITCLLKSIQRARCGLSQRKDGTITLVHNWTAKETHVGDDGAMLVYKEASKALFSAWRARQPVAHQNTNRLTNGG